jgi:hypothetical protein
MELPKDIWWLILKYYIFDILHEETPVHQTLFAQSRTLIKNRVLYEKTCAQRNVVHNNYLVDCLYPLRLICKKTDRLLREKIVRVKNNKCVYGLKVLP